jgi:translation initiation factor IF-1
MSRGKRASAAKNSRRVEAALCEVLESCTYGRVSKALGNKMFIVINTKKQERLAHIRGKMARVNAGDVVLLNIREYESRTGKDDEVYDIAMTRKQGWFPYGESKPSIPPYQLSHVFTFDPVNNIWDEQDINNYSSRQLMELLSIRYNIPADDNEIVEEKKDESPDEFVFKKKVAFKEEVQEKKEDSPEEFVFKKKDDGKFVNMLTYRSNTCGRVTFQSEVETIKSLLEKYCYDYEKVEVEYAVYDTNVTHDAKWILGSEEKLNEVV